MHIAMVRDFHLNLWDAGNYAGLLDEGVKVTFCGRGNDVPWAKLRELYPRANFLDYKNLYEVSELLPDIIDLPDAHYPFTQHLSKRHDNVVISAWDNLPGKNTFNSEAMKTLARTKKFVARSHGARRALEFDGVTRAQIRVIPGAIDTGFFHPPSDNSDRQDAVLYVGRLVMEKGIIPLMWAMASVPGVELWIVGSRGEKERLRSWADACGLADRVRWLGWQDRDGLAETYRQAKVLALPSLPKLESNPYESWAEQFGQVLIEGLASGLPIIGTRSGAIPEVGGHACGLYSTPLEWRKMAEQIDTLLVEQDKWEQMSRAARKRAELTYDQGVVGKKLLTWYRTNGVS
jgi:glycosyltransferase involved in cell wall biosynthesis